MKYQFPQVAIVGRTNSGKSTLFNRLSESKKAIVSPLINTTRDRSFADIAWLDRQFSLVDTGGLDTASLDPLNLEIQKQVTKALEKAAVIILLVDGQQPVMPQDKEMALILKKLKKPVILGINKVDSPKREKNIDPDFYKLNFNIIAKFSALSGARTGDLLDEIVKLLPNKKSKTEKEEDKSIPKIKLALIGRPNVGKSSLINAILNEERVIVSDLAHTTRDINDQDFKYRDNIFTLIDTAGLRKKSQVGKWSNKLMGKVEKEGVSASIQAMDKADICLLVFEVQQAVTSQDQTLVQLAMEYHKNTILVFNKWDIIPNKSTETIDEFVKYYRSKFSLAYHVPMIFVSAKEKLRVNKILDLALEVYQESRKTVADEDLEKLLERIMKKHKPRQKKTVAPGEEKSYLKLFSLKQIKSNPPLFYLKTPKPINVAPAVIKLIEKEIRLQFAFSGTPIRIEVGK